jgi:hypothetical protein
MPDFPRYEQIISSKNTQPLFSFLNSFGRGYVHDFCLPVSLAVRLGKCSYSGDGQRPCTFGQPPSSHADQKAVSEKAAVFNAKGNSGFAKSAQGSFFSIRTYDSCIFCYYTVNDILSDTRAFINTGWRQCGALQDLSRSSLSIGCSGRHSPRDFSRNLVGDDLLSRPFLPKRH